MKNHPGKLEMKEASLDMYLVARQCRFREEGRRKPSAPDGDSSQSRGHGKRGLRPLLAVMEGRRHKPSTVEKEKFHAAVTVMSTTMPVLC